MALTIKLEGSRDGVTWEPIRFGPAEITVGSVIECVQATVGILIPELRSRGYTLTSLSGLGRDTAGVLTLRYRVDKIPRRYEFSDG